MAKHNNQRAGSAFDPVQLAADIFVNLLAVRTGRTPEVLAREAVEAAHTFARVVAEHDHQRSTGAVKLAEAGTEEN